MIDVPVKVRSSRGVKHIENEKIVNELFRIGGSN